MTWQNLALILSSVVITAFAQVVFKIAMSRAVVHEAIASGNVWNMTTTIGLSPLVIGGFFLYGVAAVVWLFVLSKLDLSAAYPFVGLGFVVTMLFSVFLLGENITSQRLIGTLLIAVGCALVARTS